MKLWSTSSAPLAEMDSPSSSSPDSSSVPVAAPAHRAFCVASRPGSGSLCRFLERVGTALPIAAPIFERSGARNCATNSSANSCGNASSPRSVRIGYKSAYMPQYFDLLRKRSGPLLSEASKPSCKFVGVESIGEIGEGCLHRVEQRVLVVDEVAIDLADGVARAEVVTFAAGQQLLQQVVRVFRELQRIVVLRQQGCLVEAKRRSSGCCDPPAARSCHEPVRAARALRSTSCLRDRRTDERRCDRDRDHRGNASSRACASRSPPSVDRDAFASRVQARPGGRQTRRPGRSPARGLTAAGASLPNSAD